MYSIRSFYNFISPFYFCIDWFLNFHKKELIEALNQLPKGELLDVGIGQGSYIEKIKKHNITGIDLSEKMIKKCSKSHVKCIKMNAEKMSFLESTFDYVVLSHVLSVCENPNKVILESIRVLKPKGRIFILNHFSTNSIFRYIEKKFKYVFRVFKFDSYFTSENIKEVDRLQKEQEITLGFFRNYKLLIYQKP
ncbi:MAG: class I SAM-dependent methyltransferase [Flavobacteriales bacterium]|nr:class I SAM-dependent methyltransferase [Flavobacteriales bacterium]